MYRIVVTQIPFPEVRRMVEKSPQSSFQQQLLRHASDGGFLFPHPVEFGGAPPDLVPMLGAFRDNDVPGFHWDHAWDGFEVVVEQLVGGITWEVVHRQPS